MHRFVGAQTLLQKRVPDSHRGRVFGAYETTQALLLLVGMGLAAVLAAPSASWCCRAWSGLCTSWPGRSPG